MKSNIGFCVFIVCVLYLTSNVSSRGGIPTHWWTIAQDSVYKQLQNNVSICDTIDGFTSYQRRWCNKHKEFMKLISEGTRKGIIECQYQFRYRRWNCSSHQDPAIFGSIGKSYAPEMSFAHAICAAGVVHSISEACANNLLPNGSCPVNTLAGEKDGSGWKKYGAYSTFASKFVKSFLNGKKRRIAINPKTVMDDQNNRVGRKIVAKTSKTVCSPGIDGYNDTFCWEQVEDFRQIGFQLKQAYEKRTTINVRRVHVLKIKKVRRFDDGQLIFLGTSPDYCDPRKPYVAAAYIKDRECNGTITGIESCDSLCCKYRGFRNKIINITEKCNCDGSSTKCSACVRRVEKHFCN